MTLSGARAPDAFAAPGSVLEIRDETWLVTRSERATDGWFVEVQGLSELVRGTQATFSTALDRITPLDPSRPTVRVDMSPGFKQSRLWLEAGAARRGRDRHHDQLAVHMAHHQRKPGPAHQARRS